ITTSKPTYNVCFGITSIHLLHDQSAVEESLVTSMQLAAQFRQGTEPAGKSFGPMAIDQRIPIDQSRSWLGYVRQLPQDSFVLLGRHILEDVAQIEGVECRMIDGR